MNSCVEAISGCGHALADCGAHAVVADADDDPCARGAFGEPRRSVENGNTEHVAAAAGVVEKTADGDALTLQNVQDDPSVWPCAVDEDPIGHIRPIRFIRPLR